MSVCTEESGVGIIPIHFLFFPGNVKNDRMHRLRKNLKLITKQRISTTREEREQIIKENRFMG